MSPAAERRTSPTAAVILVGGLFAIGLGLRLLVLGGALWAMSFDDFDVNGSASPTCPGCSATAGRPPRRFSSPPPGWPRGSTAPSGLGLVSLLRTSQRSPSPTPGVETVGRKGATEGALCRPRPFQIFYATEARAYALLMLTCLVASYALVRALSSGRTSWWAGYGVASAAAMYTHYAAVFVVVGLFAWAFIAHPDARKPLLVTNLAAALVFAPWLPAFVDDTSKQATKNIEPAFPLTLANAVNAMIRMWFAGAISRLSYLPGALALTLIGTSIARRYGRFRDAREGCQGVAAAVRRSRPGDRPRPRQPTGGRAAQRGGPQHLHPSEPDRLVAGLRAVTRALVTAGPAPLRRAAVALLVAGFGIGALKLVEDTNRRPDRRAPQGSSKAQARRAHRSSRCRSSAPALRWPWRRRWRPAVSRRHRTDRSSSSGARRSPERLEINRRGKAFDPSVPAVAPEQDGASGRPDRRGRDHLRGRDGDVQSIGSVPVPARWGAS